MNSNQTQFEVVRDIAYLESQMKVGDTLVVRIEKTHDDFFQWHSNMGEPYGSSGIAHALKRAFEDPDNAHRGFRGAVHRPIEDFSDEFPEE